MLVDLNGNPLRDKYPKKMTVIGSNRPDRKKVEDVRQTIDEDRFSAIDGTVISIHSGASWTLHDFDDNKIAFMTPSAALNLLANNHPDVGRAIWEMHNNCVTPWKWTARMMDGEEDPIGTEILYRAAEYLETVINEPIEVKLGQLIDSAFLKDHFFTETIFDQDEFIDIKVIDPSTARWKKMSNEERGQFYQLGQEQLGQFVELDSEFIRFTPLMPQTELPYGRSVLGSSIYPCIFLLNLIRSAREVIETQAWPNKLATIDRETLYKSGIEPAQIEDLVEKLEEQVCKELKESDKGTQFIWDGAVKLELIGGMNRINLDAIPMMEKILERWIIRALKQYPITFAIDSGNALSTNAEQQSEQFSTAIDSLLRKLEALFNYHGNHILKHRLGSSYQGRAHFELKRNNAVVRKFRTDAFKSLIESFSTMRADGAITPEEERRLAIRPDLVDGINEIIKEDMPQELEERNAQNAEPEEPDMPDDDDGEDEEE